MLNRLADWFVKTFPGKTKEHDILKGLAVIVIAVVSIVSLAGVIFSWITGFSWFWAWVVVIIYYVLTVVKYSIR